MAKNALDTATQILYVYDPCKAHFDPTALVAVYWKANREKGDRGPAIWMPKNQAYRCAYLRIWFALKEKWKVSIDAKESKVFLDNNDCFAKE